MEWSPTRIGATHTHGSGDVVFDAVAADVCESAHRFAVSAYVGHVGATHTPARWRGTALAGIYRGARASSRRMLDAGRAGWGSQRP